MLVVLVLVLVVLVLVVLVLVVAPPLPVLVLAPPLIIDEQQAARATAAVVEVVTRLGADGTIAPR